MTLIHELHSPPGARRVEGKRKGRGSGSGNGKTAGKGHKGQKARRGNSKPRIGFEGGQNSLLRRLPKFGFTNYFRKEVQEVTVKRLSELEASGAINAEVLYEKGAIACKSTPVKVLNTKDFKLAKKLDLHVNAISAGAKQAIESAGGKVTIVGGTAAP
jgi:large subunit ribosomal protein L15